MVVLLLFAFKMGSDEDDDTNLSFEVQKGNLPITIVEGGSIKALESQEIRSEIKDYKELRFSAL
ncbi:MAG: hypothetical protein M2R45_05381 [Verrucomicrobia subdivision 3 bacterium]|nr:hypothetical protein [Limisphaerales bacterium]MCS1417773.1 hypothetical protein [Limisphaerales bacterium]